MALEAGTCTVNADRTVSGSGLARALAEQFVAGIPANVRMVGLVRTSLEKLAMPIATAIVDYLLANAEITVTVRTTDAGLQRTPNPNNPDTATQGPAADVELTGAIT